MANPWFKFYASDYLKEVKFKGVSANKRSCFLTLLCYASDNGGRVSMKYLTEDVLRLEAGVPMGGEAWEETAGFYAWLEDRGMGQIEGDEFVLTTWDKRQESHLTDAERAKRYRNKKEDVARDDSVTRVTLEEKRVDKKRIDKKESIRRSIDYLRVIPEEDVNEFHTRFRASKEEIRSKGEELLLYCQRTGRSYKDYRAFLLTALKKDFLERPTPEETAKNQDIAALRQSLVQGKTITSPPS